MSSGIGLERKMKNRIFFSEHTNRKEVIDGPEKNLAVGVHEEDTGSDIWKYLKLADQSKYLIWNFPLGDSVKLKLFVKKVIRKLTNFIYGRAIDSAYQQQNTFNGNVLNAAAQTAEMAHKTRAHFAQLQDTVIRYGERINTLEEALAKQREEIESLKMELSERMAAKSREPEVAEYEERKLAVFYHDFEEIFRGSRELITERLNAYVPLVMEYFGELSSRSFVDLGSGRGEWLDILRANGAVDYVGIDLNEAQNRICKSYGHKTVTADCLEYLHGLADESIDMITGFQLIEHLPVSSFIALVLECYRVLKKGGCILFETPNSNTLTVAADSFFTDPTHNRVVPSSLAKFCVEWAGFSWSRIIEANSNTAWDGVCKTDITEENREIIKVVNDISWKIFGPQDYALFAGKEES